MTKTAEERLIAALILKLGGEVIVTRAEFFEADRLELTSWDNPETGGMYFTATRPPVTLEGEVVPEPEPCYARHELAPGISQDVPHVHPTAP